MTEPRQQWEIEQRFWARVDIRGDDECWPWRGSANQEGYGEWFPFRHGPRITAHRVAYELAVGAIPPGKLVCHSCDFPPCQNPAHLWVGTHVTNALDMVAKGRWRGRGQGRVAA